MSDLVQLCLASAADACSVQTLLHRAFGCHALDAFVFSAATVELAVVQQWIGSSLEEQEKFMRETGKDRD